MDTKNTISIVVFLYDNYTALDVVGPYEVLSKLPEAKIYFTGSEKRTYSDNHGIKIKADYTLDEITQADVLLIPGGFGIDSQLNNKSVVDWIKKLDHTSQWTVSVCSGSLLLAQAGLLNGKKCTTHWRRKEQLRQYPVDVMDERYLRDGKYVSSAGVSAGIDMALYLVSLIAGEQTAKLIQLGMEYDPQPPFDWGSPNKVPKEIWAKLKK